jgi:tryptophan halogenase
MGAMPRDNALAAGLRYALHFDATRVGQYLRRLAERAGVQRLQATVAGTTRQPNGFIADLVLDDGRRIGADLFIDCSGFRGVLIGDALDVPYLDWRHWLPCDRAIAAPGPILAPRPSYTLAAAHTAGWRWQIPLQHRTGNGVVYSSRWMHDDEAAQILLRGMGEPPLDQPRLLRFTTGRREAFWAGNCVALGLASGFLEPLESTSIHLVVSGIYKLIEHFPDRHFGPHNIAAFNRHMIDEFDSIRDFIILHYCLSGRRDSAFWQYCAQMTLPDSLQQRIAIYRETGRVVPRPFDIFSDLSWFYIFVGLGVTPVGIDPITTLPAARDLSAVMDQIRHGVAQIVRVSPRHDDCFSTPLGAAD